MPSIRFNYTNTEDDDDTSDTQKYYDVLAFTMPLILFGLMICYLDIKTKLSKCFKKKSLTKKTEPVKQDKELHIEDIKELKLKKSNKEVCPICIEKFKKGQNIISLECNHQFHKDCIGSWILQNIKSYNQAECPSCRAHIKHKYKHNLNKNVQGFIIKITLD